MDYDYTGARVKKYGPLGQVLYPFAGYEIGPDGTKTKYFRVGNEIVGSKQTPVSNPEKMLFYHADHLGGTNVITDISGLRVQLTEYDPWGKVSRNDGTVDPEKRFTGQILDPESGLYYYGARYYDPELGRFISPDPVIPSPGDPQSLNRYSYTLNNPVKYIDPTGHSFWSAIGNFFKNLFRNPAQLFSTLISAVLTYGISLVFQIAMAVVADTSPKAAQAFAGGLGIVLGAVTLATGNPGGVFQMVSAGMSFCRSKGCQIASQVYGYIGAAVSMAYSSGGSTSSGAALDLAPGESIGTGAGVAAQKAFISQYIEQGAQAPDIQANPDGEILRASLHEMNETGKIKFGTLKNPKAAGQYFEETDQIIVSKDLTERSIPGRLYHEATHRLWLQRGFGLTLDQEMAAVNAGSAVDIYMRVAGARYFTRSEVQGIYAREGIILK